MIPSSDLPVPLLRLAEQLPALGVTRAASLAEITAAPGFLVSPQLRLARHFDLVVGLLVYDPELGTLGLVHLLRAAPTQLLEEVQQRIDQATYVRHLLLAGPAATGCPLPLSVELVLVCDGREHLAEIGAAVREVARETTFLEAVGLNLLICPEGGGPFAPEQLRRAFCWLLASSRSWYDATPQPTVAAPLQGIELVDFRLPGRRALSLGPSPLHLISGKNGSGKSSLVEALELAVTGTSERLGNDVDYDAVIRHRGAAGPARVTLHSGDHETCHQVGSAGVNNCLRRDLKATSFRLDQSVINRLTRDGDAQRAEVFLQSFFPAEGAAFRDYQRARDDADRALGELPEVLREQLKTGRREGEDPEDAVVRQLAWLDAGEARLESTVAAACLPLPLSTLEALAPLSQELQQLVDTWKQELPTVAEAAATLGRIDAALELLRTRMSTTLDTLRAARAALQRVEGWLAGGESRTGRDFLVDLNEWLRRCAMADLAAGHCQLLETLEEARRSGWTPEPNSVGLFGEPPTPDDKLAAQRQQAAIWAGERDELYQAVMAPQPSAGRGEAKPPVATARPTRLQREQLDQAGRWLLEVPSDPQNPPQLGQGIDQALASGTTLQVGDIAVGATSGWARPLLDRLDRLEAACTALLPTRSMPAGGRQFQALREAQTRHKALRQAGENVKESLLRQLQRDAGPGTSSLLDALNELMALFTPARWAYEDVALSYHVEAAGGDRLGFQTGENSQAALRLNTAELTVFTIALFLLCATRVSNPLGLLVMDDPLQNLDELTVTTLARGLAKVSRLWDEHWQLLLLFHGKDDCQRFRQELPTAFYQLPWLSPENGTARAQPPIEAEASLFATSRQNLADLAEERDVQLSPGDRGGGPGST